MSKLRDHERKDAIKWVLVGFAILAIIAAIVLGVFSSWYTNWDTSTWFGQEQTEAEPCIHTFDDNGVCELCGKDKEDVSHNLDIVTNNCNIKFFIDDEKAYESFGMGVVGYTIADIYDYSAVRAVSNLSDTMIIDVYKCMYTENGEFTGYQGEELLFADKTYNKELVGELNALNPTLDIPFGDSADVLYIFEVGTTEAGNEQS